jgi:excisionase family DNA binding protein
MVQEYLNLEEAAQLLGVSKEELSRKAQRREIRAFADRGTWKFRKQDIEEHARQAGIGSGAEIVFGELGDDLPGLDSGGSSDQILLSEQNLADTGKVGSGARVIGMDEHGRTPSDSDVRLVPEGLTGQKSDSDVKLVEGTKPPSDSDVKVVAAPGAPTDSKGRVKGPAAHDSDVRLDRARAPSDSGVQISGDELGKGEGTQDLPVFAGLDEEALSPLSGSSSSGKSREPDSDFELSPKAAGDSGAGRHKGSAHDSDITLALDDNVGLVPDEIKLAPKGPSDSDVTAHSPSASGINLGSPADSGIALDKAPASSSSSARGLGKTEGPGQSGGDLFETDFEVPVLDSDESLTPSSSSETAQISGDSDFELSGSDLDSGDSDSSSHVLALEGEDVVDESAATSIAPVPAEEQWDEEIAPEEFEEESGSVVAAHPAELEVDSGTAARPLVAVGTGEPQWEGGWVAALAFSTFIMIPLGMVMLDLVRTMWGSDDGQFLFYNSPILSWMSGLLPK